MNSNFFDEITIFINKYFIWKIKVFSYQLYKYLMKYINISIIIALSIIN